MSTREPTLKEAMDFLELNAYEGSNAITTLRMGDIEEILKPIRKLVNEHFNPQPYKFKDFRIGLWVYDIQPECEEFTFFKITKILSESDCDYLYHDKNKKVFIDNMTGHAREFQEDRFFPVAKALEYQK